MELSFRYGTKLIISAVIFQPIAFYAPLCIRKLNNRIIEQRFLKSDQTSAFVDPSLTAGRDYSIVHSPPEKIIFRILHTFALKNHSDN